VTAGKILHGSATLFSDSYRPRPKLVAGTWAGSSPTKLRLLPPLNLDEEELEEGFAALERALRRVGRARGLPLGV